MRTLRGAGYTAVEASQGEEAVAAVEKSIEGFDALVTDMVMPGMTGREVARRVTALRPAIHVVYMSGYTEDDVIRRGELPRHHLFLQKPFKGNELLAMLRTALHGGAAPKSR